MLNSKVTIVEVMRVIRRMKRKLVTDLDAGDHVFN